jgi:hypothetical protein
MTSKLDGILENKKEYTACLHDLLTNPITVVIQGIYDKSKALVKFQEDIAKIPEWNKFQIDETYNAMLAATKCSYFPSLVRATLITYIQATLIGHGVKASKIKLKLGSTHDFYHRCLIATARAIWKKPHLFYHQAKPVERQYNMSIVEGIIKKAINTAIRCSIPFDEILSQVTVADDVDDADDVGEEENESETSESDATLSSTSDEDNSDEEESEVIVGKAEEQEEESEESSEEENPVPENSAQEEGAESDDETSEDASDDEETEIVLEAEADDDEQTEIVPEAPVDEDEAEAKDEAVPEAPVDEAEEETDELTQVAVDEEQGEFEVTRLGADPVAVEVETTEEVTTETEADVVERKTVTYDAVATKKIHKPSGLKQKAKGAFF